MDGLSRTEATELSEVVRQIRRRSGLSQREFAQRVGTSGPTISLYESGTKEPRWSTVARMADLFGIDVRSVLDDRDRGAALRQRRSRRRRGLAAAVAAAITEDWQRAETIGRRNLEVLRGGAHVSAVPWLDAWEALLDRGPEAVAEQLLADGDEADDMRQMHPFAGVLSGGERRSALAAATVL